MHGGAHLGDRLYDPDLNLTYWGTAPSRLDGARETGRQSSIAAVIALNPDTGKLQW
jgi:glucose dehydrogenase